MNKEDVLRIEHCLLSAIDGVGTMDDTESFKVLGFMSGVSQMANQIIKVMENEMKRGGIDD